MSPNTKLWISLIFLCLLDMVIPIPITGLILIYVVLERPSWFLQIVSRVYKGR